LPARRKYLVPKGLKPVRAKLATGEVKTYWYHRATGKPLKGDPETADGLLEVAALDAKAKARTAASEALSGTFAALWKAYTSRDSQDWTSLRPRTRSDYQKVRDWLGAAADKMVVRAITAAQVTKLRDKASTEKGRRFGKYVLQVVRLVLEWGKERGWLKANPAMGLKRQRRRQIIKAAKVNRAWEAFELEAFATDCPAQLLVPFVLGLCNMREGDALSTTWTAYDGEKLEWIASKNQEPCTVYVVGALKRILDEALLRRGRAVQIAVNSYGQPWTESGFRASFFKRLRALRDAGAVKAGLTFHGLRTTIGTRSREDGESEFRVAAAIGDRSTAMAAVYGRDADRMSAQAEVMERFHARFANSDWKMPDPVNGKRVGLSRRGRG
jgi:integrase